MKIDLYARGKLGTRDSLIGDVFREPIRQLQILHPRGRGDFYARKIPVDLAEESR